MQFHCWNRGLQIAPQRTDLRAALGESYFMSGKMDKAIEEFKKVIETEPSARTYALLGLSYLRLGRFDEAKQYFQNGLKLDPHNIACLFNLGYIAERQGDATGAEAMFQEVFAQIRTLPMRCWNLPTCGSKARNLLRQRSCSEDM